jgi:hypothetical protein
MSKLSGDTLREGIAAILTASQEKQRKFTETIELQASGAVTMHQLMMMMVEENLVLDFTGSTADQCQARFGACIIRSGFLASPQSLDEFF